MEEKKKYGEIMEEKFEKLKRLLNENFDSKDMDKKISYKDSTPNPDRKKKSNCQKIQYTKPRVISCSRELRCLQGNESRRNQ